MKSVAIVILNYNGASFLERFLPSVLQSIDGFSSATVYVADNASTDSSVALLRRQFPTVSVLKLPTNDGYAGGYNHALRQIEADYYVLLNSDVAVTPGWLEPVLALMDANPAVAACQPNIRAFDRPTEFEYAGAAGGFLDYLGYAFCRGRLFDTVETDHGQYDDNRPVFWATGACLFIRAAVFHELGGFDSRFFAHMEEIDLCWRAQQAGYSVWSCGESVVYHVGGGTLAAGTPRKTFLNYRNNLLMLYKNLPDDGLWPTLLLRLVLDGLSGVRLLLGGNWRDVLAIIRAHFAFYGLLPTYRQERRAGDNKARQRVRAKLYGRSVVWQYFVQKRRTFPALVHP